MPVLRKKAETKKNKKSGFHCRTDEVSVELSNTEDNPRKNNCRKLFVISSAPSTTTFTLEKVCDKIQRELYKKRLDSLTSVAAAYEGRNS